MNLGVNWNRSLCNCDCRNLMIRGAKCLQIFFCRFLNSYFGPKCNVPAHCTRSSPAPSQAVIGCHLPPVCRHLSPIDSGSGPQVTWPEYWPLIGQDWSRDLDVGLWMAEYRVCGSLFWLEKVHDFILIARIQYVIKIRGFVFYTGLLDLWLVLSAAI